MENDYRGELPPMKDYMPEGMSKEGKETFEKWYEEQKSKGVQFHLRQELEDYCIDDVQLLRKGCLTFQHYFCKRTRFCPLGLQSRLAPQPHGGKHHCIRTSLWLALRCQSFQSGYGMVNV